MQDLSVLVIHNRYQQPGGEDAVVQAEVAMLRQARHRVLRYTRDNSTIPSYSAFRKASLFFSATWDRHAHASLRTLLRRFRPDIAHCHNLLPQVSPAAYYACKDAGVPVVQTLHNYRLFCPAGTCFHQADICCRCRPNLGHAIHRGCYRSSRPQTAAVALMLSAHRVRGTWDHAVDAYLTPSSFCRDYFISAGLPHEKVYLKQNFLARDPGARSRPGNYAFFAGRFVAEKGVLEMLNIWTSLRHIPLVVAGDGPLFNDALALVERSRATHVRLLGYLDPQQILAHMKESRFLVFPSRWQEPFGMGLIEAAACGVPAIASRVGAIPELVRENLTGLLFDADNFGELADCAEWAWDHPAEMEAMGTAARRHYEQNFTAERSYESLVKIYRSVISK